MGLQPLPVINVPISCLGTYSHVITTLLPGNQTCIVSFELGPHLRTHAANAVHVHCTVYIEYVAF